MTGCTPRVKTIEQELCSHKSGGVLIGASQPSITKKFRIENPSVLLHLLVEVFFRGTEGASDGHLYTGETWQLYTAAADTRESRIHGVLTDSGGTVTSLALPDDFETETATKRIQGEVNLLYNAGNAIAGVYVVRATWEAAQTGMGDAERRDLFAECKLAMEEQDRRVGLGPVIIP